MSDSFDGNPFDGSRAKIDRAKRHLEELNADMEAGTSQQLYGIRTRDDPQTGERVVQLLLPRKLFIQYAVVVGDVIHQLRSALDHLVWELIIRSGGVPHERPRGRKPPTGFPIFRTKTGYEERGLPMIEGINDKAAAIIRGLQPFGDTYTSDPLYLLHAMWNRDKHRLLNLATSQIVAYQANFVYPDNRFRHLITDTGLERAEDGAEVYRFSYPDDYGPGVKMYEMYEHIALSFGDGPAAGKDISKLLSELAKFVEGVMDQLVRTIP